MNGRILFVAVTVLALPASAHAAAPVGWRQDTTGVFPVAQPPQAWTADEHVLWKTRLAGSNSSPVIVGERVFVGAEPTLLVCLDAQTGEILWQAEHGYEHALDAETWAAAQRDLAEADRLRETELEPVRKRLEEADQARQQSPEDEKLKAKSEAIREEYQQVEERIKPLERYRVPQRSAGNTTASPVSDGRRIYAVCGTGVVAAYDLDGKRLWMRLVDEPKLDWGHTASPLLVGGLLIVHIQDLVALDPASGSERWRKELQPRYGSPAVCRVAGQDALVTAAGDVVRAADGTVLAEKIAEPLNSCSPVVADGVAFFIQSTARAVKLPESPGDEPQTLWETKLTEENYYASPLVHDGLLYAVSEQRMLAVLDAANGEVLYEKRLRFKDRGAVVSSLAAAGDSIYIFQETGQAKVLQAGRKYKELAENPLEGLRSSPTFAGDRLYLRTHDQVWCIGE